MKFGVGILEESYRASVTSVRMGLMRVGLYQRT
jgi:hypothetical protein